MDKGIEALTPVCVPKRIVRNWAASVMRHCDYCSHYEDTVLNDDGSAICATCCDAEHSGNLQCALEDAIQRNAELIAAMEQAQHDLNAANGLIKKIKSNSWHVDTSEGAFIPNSLDAWGRPVPQYLPYDFSGNPGASATQYCNGWNDSGGYWLNHVRDLEERLRAAMERPESSPNGMMQLSNELAEMKRKQKPAYDVTAFGQFSACDVGGELHTAITQFIFDGNPANRKGEMVPKFMLQGVINSLQEHCDKMGDESMIVIMVGAGGTVAGGE